MSGLKIGYRRGNKLAGIYDPGDWLVRFDTVGLLCEVCRLHSSRKLYEDVRVDTCAQYLRVLTTSLAAYALR